MISEEHKICIIKDGINFMTSISNAYGSEEGLKIWNQICLNLDPSIKGDIFFAMLSGKYQTRIKLKSKKNIISKVEAIKSIRRYTNLSLKDSLKIVEDLKEKQSQEIDITNANELQEAIKEFKNLGLYE